MGVCKSKTQKLNSQKSSSSRHLKINTQPTETLPSNQEIKIISTTYTKQKTMTNGTSPLSEGIILTQRSRRKLTRLPQNNFQVSLESMKQILIPTCASKKYTLIRKKQGNEAIQVVSNNKSGKIMYMETLGKHEPNNKNYILWLQNTQIDHPNIIRVQEIFENQKFYQIIYEYFEENTLYDLIQEAKKVPKSQVAQILYQILQILQYLHEQKIYHGNLSMKSFSYKIQNDSSYLIKLVDLKGIVLKEDDDVDIIKFTPPEYLYSSIHDEARDIWACVLMAYTLRKGQFPIEIQEPVTSLRVKVMVKNYIYRFDNKKDKVFKDFLSQSLNKNPKKRFKLEQLLSHKFITQNDVVKKSDQELLLYNILSAKPSCLLQQLMLNYFVQEYNWEEYLKIQKLFLEGDQDMDGFINKEELLILLKKYHFQDDIEEKVTELFQQLELKDNLNSTQFLTLVSNKKEVLTPQNIEACFTIFSIDTQSITMRGLKKHLNIDDFEEMKQQFSQLTSEQNTLNLEQFKKLLEFLI